MAIPANSVLELSFRGVVDGQRTLTIRHYTNAVAVPPGVPDRLFLETFLNAVKPGGAMDLGTDYLAVCAADFQLTAMRVQIVAPARLRFLEDPIGAAGTQAGNTQATNINGTITFRTDKSGRDQLGTIHPPALAEGTYANGLILPAFRDKLSALGDTLSGLVVLPGDMGIWRPCIWHKTRVGSAATDGITDYSVGDTVRVMRRRTVGLGI